MGLYLYCVLPPDAPDPDLAGLDDVPVRALREAGITVWVGDAAHPPAPDIDRIRDHDRVIRSALERGFTPVPIRFGQVVHDDAALRSHLEERDYSADLERVRDTVEFGIRIVDVEVAGAPEVPAPDAPAIVAPAQQKATASGSAYMRALAEKIHAAEGRRARALDAAHGMDDALGAWVRERRIEPSEQPPGAAVAHLVQTSDAPAYGARARELSSGYRPLRIIVTGPWPPYSFVG